MCAQVEVQVSEEVKWEKMDWREIIGLKPDKITDENRESIFNTLIGFDDFDRADNKSFKKLFRLSHKILQWKGEEVSVVEN